MVQSFMAHLPKHSRPCPPVVMRQFAKNIKQGVHGRAPMDNKDSCHWLSGVAHSPYIKRRVSGTATVLNTRLWAWVQLAEGILIGSMRVRLVAAVATGGSECGCASPVCPQAGYVSILALLPSADDRSARLAWQKSANGRQLDRAFGLN